MEMFANFRFVQDIARQLIQPRPCSYMGLDIWKHITNKDLYHYENPHFALANARTISLHMVENTGAKNSQNSVPSTCIVYLHGLSSFSVEGTFLVQNLQKYFSELNVSVCLYDLRGHGRDKGQNITFGLEQSKQLYQILLHLKQQKKYKHFILWGRSMGATTILKMINDLHQDIQQKDIRIKYLVLDSAFCSIEKVAIQIISRKSRMPQIFCKPVFEYLISTVEKLYKIRLEIDISNLHSLDIQALFLYSEIDNLVNAEHSKILYNKYTGPKDKIQMNVGHNDQRPDNVLNSIFEKLKQSLKVEPNPERRKSLSTKKLGLSVTKTKRIKTNQSALDGAQSCITENFYEIKTQESNKQNLKDESNKSQGQKISKSPIENNKAIDLNNKNGSKIYKIAKEQNIKELKLTKKYISLNGNMRHSVQLFRQKETNSLNLKPSCQKREQKLKLSHKDLINEKKCQTQLQEPKTKTSSIYQRTILNKSQIETKHSPKPQTQKTDEGQFKQVKSALFIRNTHQTVKDISPNTKKTEVKIRYNQIDIINKKLSFNQPVSSNPINNNNWTKDHIIHPPAKPQSTNLNLTQKRASNISSANNSQKDVNNEIRLGPKKQFANIRKSIDLELLKIQNMSPIYQSCIVSNNVTPQNASQKVVFNFPSYQQIKIGTIQRLSNQHYM